MDASFSSIYLCLFLPIPASASIVEPSSFVNFMYSWASSVFYWVHVIPNVRLFTSKMLFTCLFNCYVHDVFKCLYRIEWFYVYRKSRRNKKKSLLDLSVFDLPAIFTTLMFWSMFFVCKICLWMYVTITPFMNIYIGNT